MCVCVLMLVWFNNNVDILVIFLFLLNFKSDWRIYINSIDMLVWWYFLDFLFFVYNLLWVNILNWNVWYMLCYEGRKYVLRLEFGRVCRLCCKFYYVKDINLMLNFIFIVLFKYCKICKFKERDLLVYNMNFLIEGCKKMWKWGMNNFF